MHKTHTYKTAKGSLLVIQIIGNPLYFVAEVTNEDPPRLKVEEKGPYASLKHGDYIVIDDFSARVQKGDDELNKLVRELGSQGVTIGSGLPHLFSQPIKGIEKMLPADA